MIKREAKHSTKIPCRICRQSISGQKKAMDSGAYILGAHQRIVIRFYLVENHLFYPITPKMNPPEENERKLCYTSNKETFC